MRIGASKIKLYAPWVHSLKEKRMLVKSLLAKTESRFNVSAAEVEEQDVLQTAVLGFACVAGNAALAGRELDRVLGFVEASTDARVEELGREIL